MKTTLSKLVISVILITTTVTTICLSGCQSDPELTKSPTEQEQLAFSQLKDELASYSETFLSTHPQPIEARSGWFHFWASVRADFTGGGTSIYNGRFWIYVVCSLSNSRETWKKRHEDVLQYYEFLSDDNKLILETKLEYYRSKAMTGEGEGVTARIAPNYGALHNIALLEEILEGRLSNSLKEALPYYNLSLEPYGCNLDKTEQSDIIKEVTNTISFQDISDNTEYFAALTQLRPSMELEYSILAEYSSTASQIQNRADILTYTQNSSKLIDNSTISLERKQFLKNCLSIASASFDLWKTIESMQ